DHPTLSVTASVGIAIYPEDGRRAIQLIDRADAAMYRAKKRGGAMFQTHGADEAGLDAHLPDFLDTSSYETHPMALDTPSSDRSIDRSGDRLHSHELRRANEQLILSSLAAQEVEEQARQAYLKQVTMLAMVAHELRGPLAPIRNAAELLSRARDDVKKHAWLQDVIKRQVSHMSRIVDDLLDGSRAETGKFNLEFSNVNLSDILKATAEACQPVMDKQHQRLRMHLPQQPLSVHGDPIRLAQIFRNLLDNAAKYTHPGGQIILTAAAIDQWVVTTMSDNGIGIEAEALPRVFDLFKQDARAVAMHKGGLGIGLAVVRELVEAHGGTVTASSPGHDKGSIFVVRLPLAALAMIEGTTGLVD
ncbi:alkaline phosphatase, partial [Pelomonas sp. HMWF004]